MRSVLHALMLPYSECQQCLPCRADIGLLAAGAIVFGTQALVPAYKDSYEKWYPQIKKPAWNPPKWVFPAVWIPLKIMQSVRQHLGSSMHAVRIKDMNAACYACILALLA